MSSADVSCEDPDVPFKDYDVPCEDPDVPLKDSDVPLKDSDMACEDSDIPCEDPYVPCDDPVVPCEDADVPCEDPDVPCEGPGVPCEDHNVRDVPFEDPDVPCEDPGVPCKDLDVPCEDPDITIIDPDMTDIPPDITLINPDVKFKDLPFYDMLSELVRPTTLIPRHNVLSCRSIRFYLSPQDFRNLRSDRSIQVQFRIACLELNREQEDKFPFALCIKINNENVDQLLQYAPPLDVTQFLKPSTEETQILSVSLSPIVTKPYVFALHLVHKHSCNFLLRQIRDVGIRNPDDTTAMIKEKLTHDRDSEIAAISIRSSLICPIGRNKMTVPCRANTCTHIQCFDALSFLQMNNSAPKWSCPVCDKPAVFQSLIIDGLFLDILRKVPTKCIEVEFDDNGCWTPVIEFCPY